MDEFPKILEGLRKGELALKNDGTFVELRNALRIVLPKHNQSLSERFVADYYYVGGENFWRYVKAQDINEEDVAVITTTISVTDFLKEFRKWSNDQDLDLNKTLQKAIEEIAKNQHKAFENKSGLFSGIGNMEPEPITPEEEYSRKLEELKKAASNMGKTVKVELEDKQEFKIIFVASCVPHEPSIRFSITDENGRNHQMHNVFIERKDHIAKAIEDILNEEQ